MLKKSFVCLGGLAFVLSALMANSHADIQGAHAGVSTISPCPSFCGGIGGMSEFALVGGPGFPIASSSLINSDGSGQAVASVTGDLLMPTLGSQAFSNGNSQVNASATGMKSYDYNGVSGAEVALNFAFDGIASAPVVNDALAQASVVVMRGNNFPFQTDYGTLVFEELASNPGVSLIGTERLSLTVNGGQQSLNGSVSMILNQGDRIAVWAQVHTRGIRGGSADALNTLTTQFSDTTGLSVVSVPSPSSLPLLAVAMISTLLRRRR